MNLRATVCCDTLTYSVGRAAQLLGVGETTMRRMLRDGRMRYGLDSRGRIRIAGRNINAYLTKELRAAL